ncbi:hypothetical protein V5740_12470 [Croceibacterium sp. TMG7-5b_MA50]|uniref:hypothetical protein n=1 Tax=Croceibacterium sp. TMG7-5b_MA50 TaxID=3121290 RepID=UPI0032217452
MRSLPIRSPLLFAAALLPCLLGGCLAKAAYNVATLPVRAASGAVDLATTSQSEADEARGREIRRREEQLGKLDRDYRRQRERCEDGNEDACRRAQALYAEIQRLSPTVPLER